MEISVKMDTEDFMEFMEWQRDKMVNARKTHEVSDSLESLANKVTAALEVCGEAEYRIKSQTAAAKLYAKALDVF